jgi:hypothetical protein
MVTFLDVVAVAAGVVGLLVILGFLVGRGR